VFLTRAVRRQREPTVPSRFLQRMEAIAGTITWTQVRERGSAWLALAKRLESPAPAPAAARPAPMPALHLRPASLSVTQIATLRDNPYVIHAERILKLSPLEPLEDTPDAREHGLVLHAIVAEFAKAHAGELKETSRATLFAIAERHTERLRRDETFVATQWPRMARSLDFYWRWERERRAALASLAVETRGEALIALSDISFRLSGRADRIETHTDGSLVIVDFKTGGVPSRTEVTSGSNPQLTLEAGILRRGAFENVSVEATGTAEPAGTYVKLGGREGGDVTEIALGACIDDHWALMMALLEHYRNPETRFDVAPRGGTVDGDYEHLTRIREWSATGGLGNGDEGSA
jgi:ATP-dependent helicase/nuclease subunit B